MTTSEPHSPPCATEGREIFPATPPVPASFSKVSERLHPRIDRNIGYFGEAPFVLFYFDPERDEVVWDDGRCRGPAAGDWWVFPDQIAPLGEKYQANVGSSRSVATDALLLDRREQQAYFAERCGALQFVARQDRSSL